MWLQFVYSQKVLLDLAMYFHREVRQVLKPTCVFGYWGYTKFMLLPGNEYNVSLLTWFLAA